MIAYLSSSFLYTKGANLLLWFYADVRYGLFFTAIIIGMQFCYIIDCVFSKSIMFNHYYYYYIIIHILTIRLCLMVQFPLIDKILNLLLKKKVFIKESAYFN